MTNIINTGINIKQKDEEARRLEVELIKMKEDEERLAIDVEKLKDPEYIARYLREKYLYSSEDELIIRIPEHNEEG